MKRIMVALLLVCAVLCSSLGVFHVMAEDAADAEDSVEVEDAIEANDELVEEDEAAVPSEDATPLDLLLQFHLELEGEDISLPALLADFIGLGWELNSKEAEGLVVESNDYEDVEIIKDFVVISVRAVNPEGEARPIQECEIRAVEIISLAGKEDDKKPNLVLPGGITSDSSYEEIVGVYGPPHYVNGENTFSYGLYNSWSWDDYVYFRFYNDELDDIYIRHTSQVDDPAHVDGKDYERSIMVRDYSPPDEASDKLANAIITVDSKVIQLPAPVSELLLDGWRVLSGSEMIDARASYEDAVLYKNGRLLEIRLANYSEEDVPFEECFIIGVADTQGDTDQYDYRQFGGPSLSIATGLAVGATLEEVQAMFAGLSPEISMQGQDATFRIRFNAPAYLSYYIEVTDSMVTHVEIGD